MRLSRPTQHEVLPPGEIVVDRRVLTGEPDDAAHELRFPGHVVSRDRCPSAVEPEQRGEGADRRRLSRAVGPEQPHDRRLGHLEIDTRERGEVSEALDQALRPNTSHRPAGSRVTTDHNAEPNT